MDIFENYSLIGIHETKSRLFLLRTHAFLSKTNRLFNRSLAAIILYQEVFQLITSQLPPHNSLEENKKISLSKSPNATPKQTPKK